MELKYNCCMNKVVSTPIVARSAVRAGSAVDPFPRVLIFFRRQFLLRFQGLLLSGFDCFGVFVVVITAQLGFLPRSVVVSVRGVCPSSYFYFSAGHVVTFFPPFHFFRQGVSETQ